MRPSISVVIPVRNGSACLEHCLASLERSDTRPLELIVVDDASTDDSVRIAAHHGATVLSTGGQCGPARARNIGVQAARGDVVLFLDADVCVGPDTLSRIEDEFAKDPDMDALMGSYDRSPQEWNFMSQFRNLMHSFVHQSSRREATTFWAGCGAIRRSVFLEFNGFDEHFRSPSIEDIELGYRMAKEDRKLVLDSNIQVKHLKHWSLRSMIKTDFFYRALPWSELTIRSGWMPNDLNLRISQRISVALVFVLGALGTYLAITRGAYFLVPLFVTFFILLSYYWVECSRDNSKAVLTLMFTVMGVISGLAYMSQKVLIIPMMLLAYIALLTRHRYAYPHHIWRRLTGLVFGSYALLVIAFIWLYLPLHKLGTVFLIVLLTFLVLNKQFYLFLAGARGRLFALAAIPFHLLYFVSCGLAYMLAMFRHLLGKLRNAVIVPESVILPAEKTNARAAGR